MTPEDVAGLRDIGDMLIRLSDLANQISQKAAWTAGRIHADTLDRERDDDQ